MITKNYLLSPGPSKVPEDVLLDMAQPIFHHRTPRYQELFSEVTGYLHDIFRTRNDVYVFTSSGTGVMETSVTAFLSSGDTILTIDAGKFSQRFADIAKAFGVECITIDVEWGDSVDPQVVAEQLRLNPKIKAVYTTLSETSTGALTDIEALGAIVKETDAILVVDAISGLAADRLESDAWHVDVVLCGSQKGFMLPPGLAFMSVSQKAWELAERSLLPGYYFDLRKYKKALADNDVPWTPATSLIVGLRGVLSKIVAEGMENVWDRHARLADATREAFKALGLSQVSQAPSNAVTAAWLPETVDGRSFITYVRDYLGVTFAGGQAHLKGKIFRIGHMGYCTQFDVLTGIAAVEEGLKKFKHGFEYGSGVKRFQEAWLTDVDGR